MLDSPPSLLIYSALAAPPFRTIRIRSKKRDCIACGDNASRGALIDQSDYLELCGSSTPDYEANGIAAGEPGYRIEAKVRFSASFIVCVELISTIHKALHAMVGDKGIRIIDVRPPIEFGICNLSGSIS